MNLQTYLAEYPRLLANPEIPGLITALKDRIAEARDSGRKLMLAGNGAGGGGFLLFYAPPEKHDAIASALSDLRCIPFSMEPRGSRIIFVNQ